MIFYQPLNRDSSVTEKEWKELSNDIQMAGLDTLVVQWNQYGVESFGGPDGWVANNLALFMNDGVDIWLGLYSDPDYFLKIHTSVEKQNVYLKQYFKKVNHAYKKWESWRIYHQSHIKGLYFPLELSDYDFDTPQKRQQLNLILRQVSDTYNESLMISVYLSGELSSDEVAQWVGSIRSLGIEVYVQDGRGTQLIADEKWKDYSSSFGCGIGLIKEIFVQTNHSPFEAIPIGKYDFEMLQKVGNCNDNVLFSLRYLPLSNNPLQY
ncbi:hypothetical protein BCU71_13125 [Vibrio lentus]|nr:hypothetical protein BCU71_13125 [Vibrio lentus]PMK62651.1 hypothetical protein BCT93_13285 [Vibrio lentus]